MSPAAAPASMTCGTRERSSPTLGSSGETPTPRCAARRVLYARKVKKSRPLVGANRATLAALPLKSARQPRSSRRSPGSSRGYRRWTPWCPLAFGDDGLEGAVAVREAAPPMAPARRCATGLLRPLDDVSRRGLRMRGGAVVRASLEIVAGRIPPRETREGVARAGPGQTERRERRRARETRRRRATRALERARARGRRTRGIPVPGRRSRSRKTSSSVQDPLETSETIVCCGNHHSFDDG